MEDLRALTVDARRLYEELDRMLERQDAVNVDNINYEEILFSAKERPFKGHILCDKDELICKRYLTILSAIISLTNDVNKKTAQVRFLARILAACTEINVELKEVITDGMLMNERCIDEFQKVKDEELQVSLLIDLLLVTYLDGKAENKQLNFVIECMAMLGLEKEQVTAIGQVVKGLLEQDDILVMNQYQLLNIENVYCYMKNPPDGILVGDLEEAKKIKTKKIIFYGETYQTVREINCDLYEAEVIEFNGCHFVGINSFVNGNKKLYLNDCIFEKCETDETIFVLEHTEITLCEFKNFELNSKRGWPAVLKMSHCSITKSNFVNIKLKGSVRLIDSCDTTISDNDFIDITQNLNYQSNAVINVSAGAISNCKLINWNVAGKAIYLFDSIQHDIDVVESQIGKVLYIV